MFFYNSDSLGLLTLKADGRLRVHGGGDSVVPRWCVGGISMVSRSCLDGVPVVSQWCLGTFKEMQALRSLQVLVSKSGEHGAVLAATFCKHHATMCNICALSR